MNIRIIMLAISCSLLFSCRQGGDQVPGSVVNMPNTASDDPGEVRLPKLEFKTTTHDFGKIIQGEIVTYAFKFTNTGNADLVIAGIDASCGCTASDYPKGPVKPGGEDFIKVRFDSGGKRGFQNKTLTVAANTQPNQVELTIKAEVINPEKN